MPTCWIIRLTLLLIPQDSIISDTHDKLSILLRKNINWYLLRNLWNPHNKSNYLFLLYLVILLFNILKFNNKNTVLDITGWSYLVRRDFFGLNNSNRTGWVISRSEVKPCLESSLHNSADVAFGISDFSITVFQIFRWFVALEHF